MVTAQMERPKCPDCGGELMKWKTTRRIDGVLQFWDKCQKCGKEILVKEL